MTTTVAELTAKHRVVSREEWIEARKAHLDREKELTKLHDQVSTERRELPWVKVDKNYVFYTERGEETLADLFDGRSQLIIYHFMWRHDLGMGCDGCSFLSDHIDGANWHLPHNDVTLIAVSRAPLNVLNGYKKRMGWKFRWVSSDGADFNYDYHVSFTQEQLAKGKVYYNYEMTEGFDELPGVSVFYKDGKGDVFHTYSSYGRGSDILIGAHNYLDMTPKGRNESTIMDWVRRHDEYENTGKTSACCASSQRPDAA